MRDFCGVRDFSFWPLADVFKYEMEVSSSTMEFGGFCLFGVGNLESCWSNLESGLKSLESGCSFP